MIRSGIIRCNFCKRGAQTLRDADLAGWEWFTGYRPDTFHACGECLSTRGKEFHALRNDAMEPPMKNVKRIPVKGATDGR